MQTVKDHSNRPGHYRRAVVALAVAFALVVAACSEGATNEANTTASAPTSTSSPATETAPPATTAPTSEPSRSDTAAGTRPDGMGEPLLPEPTFTVSSIDTDARPAEVPAYPNAGSIDPPEAGSLFLDQSAWYTPLTVDFPGVNYSASPLQGGILIVPGDDPFHGGAIQHAALSGTMLQSSGALVLSTNATGDRLDQELLIAPLPELCDVAAPTPSSAAGMMGMERIGQCPGYTLRIGYALDANGDGIRYYRVGSPSQVASMDQVIESARLEGPGTDLWRTLDFRPSRAFSNGSPQDLLPVEDGVALVDLRDGVFANAWWSMLPGPSAVDEERGAESSDGRIRVRNFMDEPWIVTVERTSLILEAGKQIEFDATELGATNIAMSASDLSGYFRSTTYVTLLGFPDRDAPESTTPATWTSIPTELGPSIGPDGFFLLGQYEVVPDGWVTWFGAPLYYRLEAPGDIATFGYSALLRDGTPAQAGPRPLELEGMTEIGRYGNRFTLYRMDDAGKTTTLAVWLDEAQTPRFVIGLESVAAEHERLVTQLLEPAMDTFTVSDG